MAAQAFFFAIPLPILVTWIKLFLPERSHLHNFPPHKLFTMYQTFFEQYLSQGVPLPTAMAAARARALQSAGAQLSEQQLEVINDADCCAWVAQAITQTKGGRVTARRYS